MLFADTVSRNRRVYIILLLACSLSAIFLAATMRPVAQSLDYHQFADQRTVFGIPNFLNVVSNLAILISGLAGLLLLCRSYKRWDGFTERRRFAALITPAEYWSYFVLFASVALVSFGSAYYHWDPDNARLLWDRLPIAAGVSALLAAVLAERVHPRIGCWALPVLVCMGVGSVLYWYWSELQGAGNLNFYIVIQFYSLLLIVLICLLTRSRYSGKHSLPQAIGIYAAAKLAETLDQQIYNVGAVVSGHTVKHLLAALAIWWIVKMLHERVVK